MVSTCREGFAKFHDNKVLAKFSEFTVQLVRCLCYVLKISLHDDGLFLQQTTWKLLRIVRQDKVLVCYCDVFGKKCSTLNCKAGVSLS